jgi:hypothetical protein
LRGGGFCRPGAEPARPVRGGPVMGGPILLVEMSFFGLTGLGATRTIDV